MFFWKVDIKVPGASLPLSKFDVKNSEIKVLHVDEGDFSKVVKECLEMEGPFRVENAFSAWEAIEKLKVNKFDVIISGDLKSENGMLGFLKELREGRIDAPFIMLTGKRPKESTMEALSCDDVHFIDRFDEPEIVYVELGRTITKAVEDKRGKALSNRHRGRQ
jgi:DNA-binding NtrC family response regulator